MIMNADLKMQIEAIKNPRRLMVLDFGKTVLLTDGRKGPYIKKDKVLIDLEKIRHPENTSNEFNPDKIQLIKVKRTKHLIIMSNGKIINRFDTENGDDILWARNDWIKEYGNAIRYATNENHTSIIPIGINGEPLGIVLCVRINEET